MVTGKLIQVEAAHVKGRREAEDAAGHGVLWCGLCRTEEAEEVVERAVACWNACESVSTENLEANLPVKELADRYNAALRQNAELLAVLSTLHSVLKTRHHGRMPEEVQSAYDAAGTLVAELRK